MSNELDLWLEDDLNIICNMIFVLLLEYDTNIEVTKEDDGSAEKIATYKPLCYYVMHDGCVNEKKRHI